VTGANIARVILVAATVAIVLPIAPGAAQLSPAAGAGVPTFKPDPAWLKVPAKWKLGDVVSIAVDEKNHAWVLHRPRTLKGDDLKIAAPPVLEFDEEGTLIQAWGGAGAGYDWPQREHGIYIDYKGFVWIGGNYCPARTLANLKPVYDDQVLKFTKEGKFVMQIGKPSGSKGNNDRKNLHEPADMVVWPKTNEAFVADGYGNHRVIVFNADTGAFKRMWGAFGNEPIDDDYCPSDDNPRPPAKAEGDQGSPQFSIVHTLKISNDELVYVGDRENKRIQVFTLEGKYVSQYIYHGPGAFAGGVALSRDPEQKFLYVSGQASPVQIFDRKTLKLVGRFSDPGVRGGGHMFISDLKGNLLTAQSGRGAQRLLLSGLSPEDTGIVARPDK
jgi:DNA-binding beta-propeller fold protein YncE